MAPAKHISSMVYSLNKEAKSAIAKISDAFAMYCPFVPISIMIVLSGPVLKITKMLLFFLIVHISGIISVNMISWTLSLIPEKRTKMYGSSNKLKGCLDMISVKS